MHATEFYKNRLSFHERKLYAAISAAWSTASPTCEVNPLLRGGADIGGAETAAGVARFEKAYTAAREGIKEASEA